MGGLLRVGESHIQKPHWMFMFFVFLSFFFLIFHFPLVQWNSSWACHGLRFLCFKFNDFIVVWMLRLRKLLKGNLHLFFREVAHLMRKIYSTVMLKCLSRKFFTVPLPLILIENNKCKSKWVNLSVIYY